MSGSASFSVKSAARVASTFALVAVVSLISWLGNLNGGYFTGEWSPVALYLSALMFVASLAGVLGGPKSWLGISAIGLFAAYALWTLLSLLWSPNQGDAWIGAGLTLLYLVVFWLTIVFVALGASRRWALGASVLGPAVVAALTLPALRSETEALFDNNRLIGTVGYYNGEAAFLLVPFWVAVYLAGSRRINPVLRGLILAGAALSVSVAVPTQSRGAMLAMATSMVVFFLFSGQRLRGMLAVAPVAVTLFIAFPGLNQVYLAFLNEGDPAAALDRVIPTVWLTAAGAGMYGLLWGLIDRWWKPPVGVVRAAGGLALAGCLIALIVGAYAFTNQVGNPLVWGQQKWEAFVTNNDAGRQQSRFLSASGSGRYTLWQVAWEDFEAHPVRGVGTHNYEATYYALRDQPVGFARQPHALPLEVLAERGIVGGVLFLGFLATCMIAGLRQRFGQLNAEGKGQVGAMIAATTYWFVHSSAEWFWQLPAVTLPAMVYLAMLVAPWNRATTSASSRWSLRVAGAAVALLVVAAVLPLGLADYYAQQGRVAGSASVGLEAVEQAQRLNPVNPYLQQQEAELALRAGNFPRAEEAYREAIRLNPKHYAPYSLLAFYYQEKGEPEKALRLYRKALNLNPLDEELKQRVEQLRAETGEQTARIP